MSFDPNEDEELFPDTEAETETTEDSDEEKTLEKASKAARKLEPIVLAHVLGAKYQPVKPRVIAKQLKLPSEQHNALKLAIKRLAKAGKVNYGAGHLVRPPAKAKVQGPRSKVQGREPGVRSQESGDKRGSLLARDNKNVLIGTFRRTSKGFGFVRPQGAKRGDRTG